MTRFFPILLVLAADVLNAASLDFNFTSSLLYTQPGVPVSFAGTLTNTGAAAAYINGDTWTFGLPFDDTPFLLGAPAFLNPGQSFTGALFTISPGPGTPLGLYNGLFSIRGEMPRPITTSSARSLLPFRWCLSRRRGSAYSHSSWYCWRASDCGTPDGRFCAASFEMVQAYAESDPSSFTRSR